MTFNNIGFVAKWNTMTGSDCYMIRLILNPCQFFLSWNQIESKRFQLPWVKVSKGVRDFDSVCHLILSQWNTMKHNGIEWNTMEGSEIQWNTMLIYLRFYWFLVLGAHWVCPPCSLITWIWIIQAMLTYCRNDGDWPLDCVIT